MLSSTGGPAGRPNRHPGVATSRVDGSGSIETGLGRKSADGTPNAATRAKVRQEVGHETSRALRTEDTHTLEIDDHETSRPETRSLRSSKLLYKSSNASNDMAGLSKNGGRVGRPVRVRFKPDRLIDSYGK